MACVISFTIPMHLPASQTLDKEMRPRSALGRLSRQATSRTAIALVAPKCMSLVDRSCNCHKMNISRHVCGSGSHPFNVFKKVSNCSSMPEKVKTQDNGEVVPK
ncbi:uncharacterized protein LOC131334076 isoform X2 [Rhododendron vialii]|uniref:uncharacterized protein LOC131334076 isoform X2 n=1 Tax=Rhododendron vialii TaxID=182163 RepID=UPI00265ECE5C|nr:uncharacterized protein LOC131334076 isoform X2 [Rhododendron vialii]